MHRRRTLRNTASRKYTGIMHPNPATPAPSNRGRVRRDRWWDASRRVFKHFAWHQADPVKVALFCPTHQRVSRRSMRDRPHTVVPLNTHYHTKIGAHRMIKQNDTKAESESKGVANTLQNKLAEKMMGVFELVVSDRSGHFAKHPDKIPDKKSVPSIINSYSVANAAISGGASLVPGPWGMVAVIPEIAAVIRNQLAMIYDVGIAYGKGKVLNKELLAGVLLSAMGSSAGSLLVMQGNKVFVKRVALRVFQKIIVMLAGRITQQALKSAISKWLPVVGA